MMVLRLHSTADHGIFHEPFVTTRAPSGCEGDTCAARTSGEPNRQMQTLCGLRLTDEACLAPAHPFVGAPNSRPRTEQKGQVVTVILRKGDRLNLPQFNGYVKLGEGS